MASIRRTLSPAYHDRPYQNGVVSSSLQSKLIKNPRKSPQWRRSLYRCLSFFVIGILIGITPFGFTNDIHLTFKNDAAQHLNNYKPLNDAVNSVTETVDMRLQEVNAVEVEEKEKEKEEENRQQLSVNAVTLAAAESDGVNNKLLIIVTPTYNRAMQGYFLSRLAQLLRLVPPPLLWIVVEENVASFETAEILRKTGVMYRHLVCKLNTTSVKDRGVHQRNTALEHIELHRLDGIVYFADDDNAYSLELFDKMRGIR